VGDTFNMGAAGGLKRIQIGEKHVMLEHGQHTLLAVVYSGMENRDNFGDMNKFIKTIEDKYGEVLHEWDGRYDNLDGIRGDLCEFLGIKEEPDIPLDEIDL
ncbi:MAG: hypothetical protein Q7J68_07630, partial [Thermoplasmata archaeon]|nr:hypothetical protein [Thermoplasmata archaeon]